MRFGHRLLPRSFDHASIKGCTQEKHGWNACVIAGGCLDSGSSVVLRSAIGTPGWKLRATGADPCCRPLRPAGTAGTRRIGGEPPPKEHGTEDHRQIRRPLPKACHIGPLKCVSKSVQVLLNGIEASYGTDFDNSEIESPAATSMLIWRSCGSFPTVCDTAAVRFVQGISHGPVGSLIRNPHKPSGAPSLTTFKTGAHSSDPFKEGKDPY